MDGLWAPVLPDDARDARAFLLFAMAWCVQRRLVQRDRHRAETHGTVERVCAQRRAENIPMQADTVAYEDEAYYPAAIPQHETAEHNSRRRAQFRVAVASWLLLHLHDGLWHHDGQRSALAQLRVTCRQWSDLAPRLVCCDCGQHCRVGDGILMANRTFVRSANHGPVDCKQCLGIQEEHLRCVQCAIRADEESDSWDRAGDFGGWGDIDFDSPSD